MPSRKLVASAALAVAVAAGGLVGSLIGAPGVSGAQDSGTGATVAPAAGPSATPATPTDPDDPANPTDPAAPTDPADPATGPRGRHRGQPGKAHDRSRGGHVGVNGTKEELLTGDVAAKVTAAAQAAVPGATIDRVESDADGEGVYEAHVTRSDGTEATVILDANFAVTSVS